MPSDAFFFKEFSHHCSRVQISSFYLFESANKILENNPATHHAVGAVLVSQRSQSRLVAVTLMHRWAHKKNNERAQFLKDYK